MRAEHVQAADLRIGLTVEFLGGPDDLVVESLALKAAGVTLWPGHPGRVWDATTQHVRVTWVGLEDEPATYAVGFSLRSEQDRTFSGLGLLSTRDYDRRRLAVVNVLASGHDLTNWNPPWNTRTGF